MNADLKMISFVPLNGQVSFSEVLTPDEMPQGLHQLYVFLKAQNYPGQQHHGYWK